MRRHERGLLTNAVAERRAQHSSAVLGLGERGLGEREEPLDVGTQVATAQALLRTSGSFVFHNASS